jgi:hypothetical protein
MAFRGQLCYLRPLFEEFVMFVRTLAAVAALSFPVDALAQCKPSVRCQKATPKALTIAPSKPKIMQPKPRQLAPVAGTIATPPRGTVGTLPKINTPQPPAQRQGRTQTRPAAAQRPSAGGTVMNAYICQTAETYCRLNTFEVVASGAACHCRGAPGKIE